MRGDDQRQPSHFFRQGSRASFLYPSWLSPQANNKALSPFYSQPKQLFKHWLLKLRLTLINLITHSKPHLLAQRAYFRALLDELELRRLNPGEQNWQKNQLHQLRQSQLVCFEQILQAYDQQLGQVSSARYTMHAFPEIMLVMAKTLLDSQQSQPELTQCAEDLVKSYNLLREQLLEIASQWSIKKFTLEASHPLLAHLLRFREKWSAFRHCRSLQIKQHANPDNPAIDSLSQSLIGHHEDP